MHLCPCIRTVLEYWKVRDMLLHFRYCGAAIENMRVGVDFSVVAALMDMFTLEASQKIKVCTFLLTIHY